MPLLTLKSIISRKKDVQSLLYSLAEGLSSQWWVEDEKNNIVFGEPFDPVASVFPVVLENELLGWVKGDEKCGVIADFITQLAHKEWEKKKLGGEVLNLYQEINLIFNFSERLAQTIDAPAICEITLNEASRVIRSGNGAVIMWDDSGKQLQVMASLGKLFFDQEKINNYRQLLFNILKSGQSEISTDLSSLIEEGIILPEVKSIIYSALKVKHRIMGAIVLAGNEEMQYTAGDLKLLTTLALQSSSAIESALLYEQNIREAKEREEAMRRVYEVTGKFVPYEFIGSLGYQFITDVKLGDQVEKIVTVIFSDIRDYTTLSEKMTPEENFRFVCSFNERMGPIIRRNKGFINQYLGDAIMAIFPGNAADALHAAVEMQNALQELNAERLSADLPAIQIGLGMHTGPLIMGITGDQNRLDATTIADSVNIASRLESLTKYYKTGIIISDASLQQIEDPSLFHLRDLGLVQLKGKQETLRIHECFSGNPIEELRCKLSTLALFNEAMFHYVNKSFEKARDAFHEVIGIHPADRTAVFFYNKASQLIANVSTENWMGVVEMQEK